MSGAPARLRAARPDDAAAVERLYPAAFPHEDLVPLVRKLLPAAPILSLVAESDDAIVAHIAFTRCGAGEGADDVALLGPLAVAPARQRQGIGGALMREGFARLGGAGVRHVVVLGDPAYYGRFGFARENRLMPPYPLPAQWGAAWQSLRLGDSAPMPTATLWVPAPWREPALWGA
ncbi:MAG: N-acetyltransferase [Acuticoccus sp.]